MRSLRFSVATIFDLVVSIFVSKSVPSSVVPLLWMYVHSLAGFVFSRISASSLAFIRASVSYLICHMLLAGIIDLGNVFAKEDVNVFLKAFERVLRASRSVSFDSENMLTSNFGSWNFATRCSRLFDSSWLTLSVLGGMGSKESSGSLM